VNEPCPSCGHVGKGRHFRKCARVPNRPRIKLVDDPRLEMARDWFDRFGYDESVISPLGRELFAFLLSQVERLQNCCG
jgi:hypothetical protein